MGAIYVEPPTSNYEIKRINTNYTTSSLTTYQNEYEKIDSFAFIDEDSMDEHIYYDLDQAWFTN